MNGAGLDPDRQRPKDRHPRGAAYFAFSRHRDDPDILLPRLQRVDPGNARAWLAVAAEFDAREEVREILASRYREL
jgi:hypothetical protein